MEVFKDVVPAAIFRLFTPYSFLLFSALLEVGRGEIGLFGRAT